MALEAGDALNQGTTVEAFAFGLDGGQFPHAGGRRRAL